MTPAEIRARSLADFAGLAKAINDSAPVMAVFAAPEFDELHDDGRQWVAALVREAFAQRAEMDSRGSFRSSIHVPGLWRCAKCQFVLMQSNLNAADGTVTSRDEAGEHCPNDGAPLWRVTWQEHAKDLGERLEQAFEAARASADDSDHADRPSDDDLDRFLPEHVRAEKRCGVQRSAWMDGWFVPWSPRNENENAEGPWSHWVALAHAILKQDAAARAALASAVQGEG